MKTLGHTLTETCQDKRQCTSISLLITGIVSSVFEPLRTQSSMFTKKYSFAYFLWCKAVPQKEDKHQRNAGSLLQESPQKNNFIWFSISKRKNSWRRIRRLKQVPEWIMYSAWWTGDKRFINSQGPPLKCLGINSACLPVKLIFGQMRGICCRQSPTGLI